MNFRERPEYQQWRDDVFRLFGNLCIRCGHARNIHAHHVRPVKLYPELAFDPNNGVPLCGNCHTDVTGDEMAFVQELETRQQRLLGGTGERPQAANTVTEEELRRRAEYEPRNADVVAEWFRESTDSQQVIDFYNAHHTTFNKTVSIYVSLARHLAHLNRHADALRAADAASKVATRDGAIDEWIHVISGWRSEWLAKLGRGQEAISYLEGLVSEFPNHGGLHHSLAIRLMAQSRNDPAALDEALRQVTEAVRLCPRNVEILDCAALITRLKKDYASSFRYANAILAVAVDTSGKIVGHLAISDVYASSGLYDDAIRELRHILEVDENNVSAMSHMAHCFYMDGRPKDALRMATRCLLIDPDDGCCQDVVTRIRDQ